MVDCRGGYLGGLEGVEGEKMVVGVVVVIDGLVLGEF
jgi:hypothetical protein